MQSTHIQTLEVIGEVPPLRLRFPMLNHRYLISIFSTGAHPFRRLLVVLSRLNSTKMVWHFDMVGDYDLEPVRSIYDYPLEALLHVPNGTNFCWKGLLTNGSVSVGGIRDVGI
jgi:hypothetical protein